MRNVSSVRFKIFVRVGDLEPSLLYTWPRADGIEVERVPGSVILRRRLPDDSVIEIETPDHLIENVTWLTPPPPKVAAKKAKPPATAAA